MYRPIGMGSDGFQPAESSPKATRASAPAPPSQRSKPPQRRPSIHRPSLELSSQSDRPRGPIADGAGERGLRRCSSPPRNSQMPTLRQPVDERLGAEVVNSETRFDQGHQYARPQRRAARVAVREAVETLVFDGCMSASTPSVPGFAMLGHRTS